MRRKMWAFVGTQGFALLGIVATVSGCNVLPKEIAGVKVPEGSSSTPEPAPVTDRNAPVGSAPDWCTGWTTTRSPSQTYDAKDSARAAEEIESWIENGKLAKREGPMRVDAFSKVAPLIAEYGCERPSDSTVQTNIEKWRQMYVNYYGAKARDFNDLLFVAKPAKDRTQTLETYCNAFLDNPAKDKDYRSAKDDLDAGVLATACSVNSLQVAQKMGWFGLDMPKSPVVVSLAHLVPGLGDWKYPALDNWSRYFDFKEGRKLGWFRNTFDFDNLDGTRLEAEIKDYPIFVRTRVREIFYSLRDRVKERDAAVAALGPKQKKIYEATLAGFKAWEVTYQTNKEGVDLAMSTLAQIATTGSAPGCKDKLRAAITSAAKSLKPKSGKEAWVAFNRAPLLQLTRAYSKCLVAEDDGIGGASIGAFLRDRPYYFVEGSSEVDEVHGPREAALRAGVSAFANMKPVPQDVVFEGGTRVGETRNALADSSLSSGERIVLESTKAAETSRFGLYGTVASVNQKGENVEVAFKKMKITRHPLITTTTNRVIGIDKEGKLEYESSVSWGKGYSVDITEEPIQIRKEHATGIAPGVVLTFALYKSDKDAKARDAFPLLLHADIERKKLKGFFGVAF